MNDKNWIKYPQKLKIPSFWKIQENYIQNLHHLFDWCLYVLLRNIFLKLSLISHNPTKKQMFAVILTSEYDFLSGTVTLFDIESKKSHDPEEHLYRTMKKMKPTIQEAVISKILTDLQLQYITQWIIRFNDRNYVFDFLVEPNMVIECTFTDRTPSAVISWLQSRALVLDNKFKALKTSVTYDNVSLMFLESTRLSPTRLKANIRDLEYTDKLITSINEFEAFLGEWKQNQVVHGNEEIPEPTAEVEVPAWAVKDPQSTLEKFI